MTKSTLNDDVLDQETLELLSSDPAALDVPAERLQSLRRRVMRHIDQETAGVERSFRTIRAADGPWIEIAPKLRKKVLFVDPVTGAESYLLQADPGAEAPGHRHDRDEHCLVLEGDVTFEDGVRLQTGDYHFAPHGSTHGIARTEQGVLVYIQTV